MQIYRDCNLQRKCGHLTEILPTFVCKWFKFSSVLWDRHKKENESIAQTNSFLLKRRVLVLATERHHKYLGFLDCHILCSVLACTVFTGAQERDTFITQSTRQRSKLAKMILLKKISPKEVSRGSSQIKRLWSLKLWSVISDKIHF